MSYKWWSFIAICLFGIGLAFGLATPPSIVNLMSKEIAALQEFSRMAVPFTASTVILIFVKNASALLLSFILSPFLCLVPILSLVINGWLMSFISSLVVQEKSLGFVLAGLLPHGIFEIPAFIIGQAAALSFGTMAMLALVQKGKRKLLLPNLKQNLRYLLVAFALLLPAAIIETYITPLLIT